MQFDDLASLATNATKLFDLAQQHGIELNWKLLAFMCSSWALVEAAKRIGGKGGCVALRGASAAWKWATSERPLCEREQLLVDRVSNGRIDDSNRHLFLKTGDGIVVSREGVFINDVNVSPSLTKQCKAKIEKVRADKLAQHHRIAVELERDRANALLDLLKPRKS